MYCPEHIVFHRYPFMLTMYWQDVPRHRIPWRVWLNPLRYEFRITSAKRNRSWVLNPNGRAAYIFANFLYRVRCVWNPPR